jgi:hypothetical protein
MNIELYRVEMQPIAEQAILDTKDFNYGKLLETGYYDHFLTVYDRIISKINIPVDFLVSVNNQIHNGAEDYLELINACVHGNYLNIFELTQNVKHKGYTIPVVVMHEFLQSFDENNQYIFFDNGPLLWEYFFEKVRLNEFSHLPKRFSSTFFFDNTDNCNYYRNNHLNGIGKIKGIELIETRNLFQGDMKILDDVEISISRDELIEMVRKYWRGEQTDNPIIEIIFQGTYRFKD